MPDLDSALDDDIGDEMLRLIFTACHPRAVARGPRGAGAAHDLRPDDRRDRTRLPAVRRRPSPSASCAPSGRFRSRGWPTRPRAASELSERLASVLEVVYLIFNEGYTAARGDDWLRPQLCHEALRMGRVLTPIAPTRARSPWTARLDGAERLAHRRAHRCRRASRSCCWSRTARSGTSLQIRRGMQALGERTNLAERRWLLRRCRRPSSPATRRRDGPTIPTGRASQDFTGSWRRWCARRSSNSTARSRSAWLTARKRGWRSSTAWWTTGLENLPPAPSVRGDLLHKLGRYEEARAALRSGRDAGGQPARAGSLEAARRGGCGCSGVVMMRLFGVFIVACVGSP